MRFGHYRYNGPFVGIAIGAWHDKGPKHVDEAFGVNSKFHLYGKESHRPFLDSQWPMRMSRFHFKGKDPNIKKIPASGFRGWSYDYGKIFDIPSRKSL